MRMGIFERLYSQRKIKDGTHYTLVIPLAVTPFEAFMLTDDAASTDCYNFGYIKSMSEAQLVKFGIDNIR